jgi:hypothetical protein
MNRRSVLKLGALAGAGLFGGYEFFPPGRSRVLEPVDTLARRLYTGLSDDQRAEACVPYDHPLRQYHNRGVMGGGRSVFLGFNRQQRGILTDLMYASLSEDGARRIPEEYFTQWSGVQSMRVLICGDPTSPPYQIILTGVHLNLRIGGKSREGVAFGGPQVYGDQRGNDVAGLPGNVYRDHFLLAQKLLNSLDSGRKKAAFVEEAPVQTQIDVQGRHGTFPGIPLAELTSQQKSMARDVVDRILSTYPSDDVAYAHECLTANGGMDKLFLSYYGHGTDGDIFEGQVFRLEGPGAVFYFRGYPHVHAFVNVAADGDSPLSVGEPLGENPTFLEHRGVKELFETAMRVQTGSDFAYYEVGAVAGTLRRGMIRSGDIYTLESWQDAVKMKPTRGTDLNPVLVTSLREQSVEVNPAKTYTIATATGTPGKGPMLRDLTVDYVRRYGFGSLRA